jgi:dolichol kinase
MRALVSEAAVELFAVIGSALAAAVFTAVGLLTEQDGLQKTLAGHLTLGAWEVGFGVIFLVVGVYLIGYREFWPRLSEFRAR